MDTVHYKDFEIHAAPYRLADSGQWQVNLHIVRYREGERKSRNFSSANSYKTREEAVQHCFQLGRQIIDGQSSGSQSVADL
jgi:hypothetical protein